MPSRYPPWIQALPGRQRLSWYYDLSGQWRYPLEVAERLLRRMARTCRTESRLSWSVAWPQCVRAHGYGESMPNTGNGPRWVSGIAHDAVIRYKGVYYVSSTANAVDRRLGDDNPSMLSIMRWSFDKCDEMAWDEGWRASQRRGYCVVGGRLHIIDIGSAEVSPRLVDAARALRDDLMDTWRLTTE